MDKSNKQYFDLSESLRPDLHDNTNKKALNKMKDEAHSLLITEYNAPAPKSYSYLYQSVDEYNKIQIKNKIAQQGIPKAVIDKELSNDDFRNTLIHSESLPKKCTSIRSFIHQLFTCKQEKIALTPYYDKLKLLDAINCEPYGYNPL